MCSDDTVKAWCPACGKPLQRLYPRCTVDLTPTPVFLEINALTHYLIGVPTFVEFRMLNCSDEPVSLEAFEVKMAGRTLEPGIYPENPQQELPPGEEEYLLVDRKVDFGIEKLMPGEYCLQIELVYAQQGKPARLRAQHPVRFSQALDRRIYAYDCVAQGFITYEGGRLPNVEPAYVEGIGEQTIRDQRVMHLCRIKQDAGLRFLPLRVQRVEVDSGAQAGATKGDVPACENCGAVLKDSGAFCHACGRHLDKALPPTVAAKNETQGYCPHCTFPRGRLGGVTAIVRPAETL